LHKKDIELPWLTYKNKCIRDALANYYILKNVSVRYVFLQSLVMIFIYYNNNLDTDQDNYTKYLFIFWFNIFTYFMAVFINIYINEINLEISRNYRILEDRRLKRDKLKKDRYILKNDVDS
jgi:hypothetical protein